jgi:mxaL protein
VPGLIIGVGDLVPYPIPKSDPMGRPLGFWKANEVMQTDPRSQGRGASQDGEKLADDGAGPAASGLGNTPGREHLSALREGYLRLLSSERGMTFLRLQEPEKLAEAMRAPALAKPVEARADLRVLLAAIAFGLLIARCIAPLKVRAWWARGIAARLPTRRQTRDSENPAR